ncbi:MAG: HAD family hydrolase [Polyangiales bacterium]
MAIPRGAVRAISFDYGHVLGGLDLEELLRRLEELGGTATGRAQMPAVLAALHGALPEAYRAHDDAIGAGLGHERAWRRLMERIIEASGKVGASHLDETVDALWWAQPMRNLWRWVPDEARALLAELGAAGVPMVVTSNSEGRAAELLEEVGLARHFRAILDSGRTGFAKPDRRMFEQAAASLGVDADSMVHVGDSESADVVGAVDAGAFAIRFDAFVPGAATRPTAAHARAGDFSTLRRLLLEALDLP